MELTTTEEKYVWTQFFCSVKGWQHHPGNKTPLSTHECAKIADDMMDEFRDRTEGKL